MERVQGTRPLYDAILNGDSCIGSFAQDSEKDGQGTGHRAQTSLQAENAMQRSGRMESSSAYENEEAGGAEARMIRGRGGGRTTYCTTTGGHNVSNTTATYIKNYNL